MRIAIDDASFVLSTTRSTGSGLGAQEAERGAAAGGGPQLDASVVCFGDRRDDGESESRSRRSGAGGAGPVEAVEDIARRVLGQAGAVIADLQHRPGRSV